MRNLQAVGAALALALLWTACSDDGEAAGPAGGDASAPDAGGGAAGSADDSGGGGSDSGASGGTILCGEETCAVGTEVCCLPEGCISATDTTDVFAACQAQFPGARRAIRCDDSADCASGEMCCAASDVPVSECVSVTVPGESACAGVEQCEMDGECRTPETACYWSGDEGICLTSSATVQCGSLECSGETPQCCYTPVGLAQHSCSEWGGCAPFAGVSYACTAQDDCAPGLDCCAINGPSAPSRCFGECGGAGFVCTSDAECPADAPRCLQHPQAMPGLMSCRCGSSADCAAGEQCCTDGRCHTECPAGYEPLCSRSMDCPSSASVCLEDPVLAPEGSTCACAGPADCAPEACCIGTGQYPGRTACMPSCGSTPSSPGRIVCASSSDCPASAPDCIDDPARPGLQSCGCTVASDCGTGQCALLGGNGKTSCWDELPSTQWVSVCASDADCPASAPSCLETPTADSTVLPTTCQP